MASANCIVLDGAAVPFEDGETILEVADRVGVQIPTLCNDSRLDPVGACRTCLVEVEGQRRLIPACTTKATAGMVVASANPRVERHQKALFALYLADNISDEQTSHHESDLHRMAFEIGAPNDWPRMESLRDQRSADRNPYIEFRADRCILCARCTRYCEEVEGVSAITLAERGVYTTIATSDDISLMDSSCEMCGGCIDVCPTGAMVEKMPLQEMTLAQALKPQKQLEKVRTTCNYCGVGCQMELEVDREANNGAGKVVKISSPPTGTLPNDGNLCVKGRFAYNFIEHEDRLTVPLVRGEDGELHEATWDEALTAAARGLMGVAERHGADALGFVSSSRCTGEENYLVQKLARAVFGTNNVHQCAAT